MAGALAQQVWTRAGLAAARARRGRGRDRRRGARARARRARDRARGRRGGQVARRARAALARARRRTSSSAATRRASRGGGSVTDVGGLRGRHVPARPAAGSPCRRRSSGRSTRRSAARPRSTSPPRTTSARSGSRRRVLCDPELLATLPPREWAGGMAEVREDRAARRRPAVGARRGLGAGPRRRRARAPSSCSAARAFKTLVVADDPRGARAARDPQPRAHDRPRHRGGGGLRRPLARRVRRDRARRRAAALRAARGPRRRARAERRRAAARSATACPCARPGSIPPPCSQRDAPRQEARAPARTAWCCSRRVGRPVHDVEVGEDAARRGRARLPTARRRLDCRGDARAPS